MDLMTEIPEGALVGLDTMAWIYEFEGSSEFGPIVRVFFRDCLGAGRNEAGSSLLVLGELLVQPLVFGRADLAEEYCRRFVSGSGFTVWEVSRAVVELAASLRAKYKLKMLDSLHLAAALSNGAAIFLSNDEGLRRVTELKVLVLADFVTP